MFFVIMGKKRRNEGKEFQKTKLSHAEQAFCLLKCTTFQWRKISVQGGTLQIH
jgi:hypothetical protein